MKDPKEIWNNLSYEQRLAAAMVIFETLCDHAGSFRYLIYDRLGFGHDAYIPLYSAGGIRLNERLK